MENELEQLVANYQTDDSVHRALADVKIGLLVGVAGSGKDTIKHALIQQYGNYRDVVSFTTRKPRTNQGVMEREGVEYHFINNVTAVDMLRQHQFIEAKFVHTHIYGTGLSDFLSAKQHGHMAITDIDIQGAMEYEKLNQTVRVAFVVPPTFRDWMKRLRGRYSSEDEFQQSWKSRRKTSTYELATALSRPEYFFVINDRLAPAVAAVNHWFSGAGHPDDSAARAIAQQLALDLKECQ